MVKCIKITLLFLFVDDAEDLIPMLYDDDAPKKCVTMHRSTMKKDLIEIFSDPNISNPFLISMSLMQMAIQKTGGAREICSTFLLNSGRIFSLH